MFINLATASPIFERGRRDIKHPDKRDVGIVLKEARPTVKHFSSNRRHTRYVLGRVFKNPKRGETAETAVHRYVYVFTHR